MTEFYKGNMQEDASDYRGWLLGHFVTDTMRNTSNLEVKYWRYDVGYTGHDRKVSKVTEVVLLLEGLVRGNISEEYILLQAGEYLLIQPGVTSNLPTEVIDPTVGITIKAPSISDSKLVVE